MLTDSGVSAIAERLRTLERDEQVSFLRRLASSGMNSVFACGDKFVFKRFTDIRNFKAETEVLRHADHFSFAMPRLLDEFVDESGLSWAITEFQEGEMLFTFLPRAGHEDLERLTHQVVDAIADFETQSVHFPHLGVNRWTIVGSQAPLFERLLHGGVPSDLLDAASDLLQRGDLALESFRRVPCFDAYFGNILVPSDAARPRLVFLDFDKSYRSVPAGEQLTHLTICRELLKHRAACLARYAEITATPLQDVEQVTRLCAFARALAGIRDNSAPAVPAPKSSDLFQRLLEVATESGVDYLNALNCNGKAERRVLREFIGALRNFLEIAKTHV